MYPLPSELIYHVFSFLDLHNLLISRRLNKSCEHVANDVIRKFCNINFPTDIQLKRSENLRERRFSFLEKLEKKGLKPSCILKEKIIRIMNHLPAGQYLESPPLLIGNYFVKFYYENRANSFLSILDLRDTDKLLHSLEFEGETHPPLLKILPLDERTICAVFYKTVRIIDLESGTVKIDYTFKEMINIAEGSNSNIFVILVNGEIHKFDFVKEECILFYHLEILSKSNNNYFLTVRDDLLCLFYFSNNEGVTIRKVLIFNIDHPHEPLVLPPVSDNVVLKIQGDCIFINNNYPMMIKQNSILRNFVFKEFEYMKSKYLIYYLNSKIIIEVENTKIELGIIVGFQGFHKVGSVLFAYDNKGGLYNIDYENNKIITLLNPLIFNAKILIGEGVVLREYSYEMEIWNLDVPEGKRLAIFDRLTLAAIRNIGVLNSLATGISEGANLF